MNSTDLTTLIAITATQARAKGALRSFEGLPPCLAVTHPRAFALLENAKTNLAALEAELGAAIFDKLHGAEAGEIENKEGEEG